MENKIDPESAEADFNTWSEAMDLDFSEDEMDTDTRTQFLKQKKLLIKAICRGSLIINEEGEAVFTPENKKSKAHGEAITFHEQDGAAMMAQDRRKLGHDLAKMFVVLGAMCKVHVSKFSGMVGRDNKICIALFSLLMD